MAPARYLAAAKAAAKRYGIPQRLLLSQINAESGWNPNAVSSAGAVGLMQLMPDTARSLGVNPRDPIQNIDGGARYLRQQYDRFGSWQLALAAYVAGPASVTSGRWQNIPAAVHYVNTVMGGSGSSGASGGSSSSLPSPGRVDQGVDYNSSSPYRAVASGTVVNVAPRGSFWNPNGTGEAVYVKLDQPITVNGRSYTEIYYAEQRPLVKVGQRVNAGDPVMGAGSAEIGFASGAAPVAKLVGGVGAGTQATQAGQDFLDWSSGSSGNVQTVPDAGGGGSPTPSPAAPSGPQITPPAPVLPPSSPLNSAPAGGVEMPGSQNYSMDQYVNPYSLWQQVGQSNLVSQETQLLMSNAALAAGSTG